MDETARIAAENKRVLLRNRATDEWRRESHIELSRDSDAEVRDWATFALALRDEDDEVTARALLDRIDDPDFDTRCEALWGLARRRDERGLQPLVDALQREAISSLLIEAAGFFARHEFIAPLQEI